MTIPSRASDPSPNRWSLTDDVEFDAANHEPMTCHRRPPLRKLYQRFAQFCTHADKSASVRGSHYSEWFSPPLGRHIDAGTQALDGSRRYSEIVGDQEFDPWNKADALGKAPRGRLWVRREARNEYLQPTYGVSFKSALIVVALFIGILVGVYVLFT